MILFFSTLLKNNYKIQIFRDFSNFLPKIQQKFNKKLAKINPILLPSQINHRNHLSPFSDQICTNHKKIIKINPKITNPPMHAAQSSKTKSKSPHGIPPRSQRSISQKTQNRFFQKSLKTLPTQHISPQTTSKRKMGYKPPQPSDLGTSPILGGLRIVLLGAPGCGKGSFSKYISSYYKIPTISTGDILRNEIKKNSALGVRVRDIAARGELVDDVLIMEMLSKRLEEPDTSNGYILDGFPRTLPQAKALEELSRNDTTVFHPPNVVLSINLREDVNIAKALGRRVCGSCGSGYNVAHIVEDGGMFMPAILPDRIGIDDIFEEKLTQMGVDGKKVEKIEKVEKNLFCNDPCGGQLLTRVDDTVETIATRLQVYNKNTKPLVDYYTEQDKLLTWDVVRGLEDSKALLNLIDSRLVELGFNPAAKL